MTLETLPLFLCGDLNSKPDDSVNHLIENKKYLLDEESGRLEKEFNHLCYSGEDNAENVLLFNLVQG